jgi:hypothetical protein
VRLGVAVNGLEVAPDVEHAIVERQGLDISVRLRAPVVLAV